MRAAWYDHGGAAKDVIEVGTLPEPEPKQGEVRVRIHASGINPRDVRMRQELKSFGKLIIPHSDGAGVVDRVGPLVAAERLGERVWVFNAQWRRRFGTAAEFVVLPQEQAVRLPENTSFEEGACLGTPGLTAAEAIRRLGNLAGKTLMITGGGSSVGFYATQIAKAAGAMIIATASARRADIAERAGAFLVLDRDDLDLAKSIKDATAGKGVDHIVDLDLAALLPLLSSDIVAQDGKIIAYGSSSRDGLNLSFTALLVKSLSIQVFGVHTMDGPARSACIATLQDLLLNRKLSHSIGQSFQLADLAAAHEAVESGKILGNIVAIV